MHLSSRGNHSEVSRIDKRSHPKNETKIHPNWRIQLYKNFETEERRGFNNRTFIALVNLIIDTCELIWNATKEKNATSI